jgi:putative transposase
MSRPPRVLFPGAIYHVTSRGNRRANIFVDDKDRHVWLDTLATVVSRVKIVVHAFCLMPNHYHLLIETPEPNLPQAMHYLNSNYARRYNQRHQLPGHLIQGRYNALLVERESQLLEVARYISLNPVRARLVDTPEAWRWSSHRYCCGHDALPSWLTCDTILGMFNNSAPEGKGSYRDFVMAGIGKPNPLRRHSESTNRSVLRNGPIPSLEFFRKTHEDRGLAIALAFHQGCHSRHMIAASFHVSLRTVDRALAQYRARTKDEPVAVSVPDPGVDTNGAMAVSVPDPDVDTGSAVEGVCGVGINAAKAV